MSDPLRVVVADDHPVMRDGAAMSLSAAQGLCVVGYAGDGRAARRVVAEHHPDVTLLDLRLGGVLSRSWCVIFNATHLA